MERCDTCQYVEGLWVCVFWHSLENCELSGSATCIHQGDVKGIRKVC